MTYWVRFRSESGQVGFGTRSGDEIRVHRCDVFDAPEPTGATCQAAQVTALAPCVPSKIVALWNNFHALAAKLGKAAPSHPMYLIKPATSVIGDGEQIRRPRSYAGKIAFEGELGIVIGRQCRDVALENAGSCIFGYTCLNDVTAMGVMNENPDFVQWCRAKGYDTFCCLGPVIATQLDWRSANLATRLDGAERQRYALADMIFSPAELVSRISHDMSLLPGDVIACGTSLGVGSIPDGSSVEVHIDGIGSLVNRLGPASPASPAAPA